jgi:hypothetical protein
MIDATALRLGGTMSGRATLDLGFDPGRLAAKEETRQP